MPSAVQQQTRRLHKEHPDTSVTFKLKARNLSRIIFGKSAQDTLCSHRVIHQRASCENVYMIKGVRETKELSANFKKKARTRDKSGVSLTY